MPREGKPWQTHRGWEELPQIETYRGTCLQEEPGTALAVSSVQEGSTPTWQGRGVGAVKWPERGEEKVSTP